MGDLGINQTKFIIYSFVAVVLGLMILDYYEEWRDILMLHLQNQDFRLEKYVVSVCIYGC